MKSDFKFTRLCGTVYSQGNLVFSPDGNSIYSPVGNRVTCFDLVNSKSFTLPFNNRVNVAVIALSPSGTLLLSIDQDGHAILANTNRRLVIASHHFKAKVRDAAFSPDGKFILVTHGRHAQVWKTPGFHREYSPFVLHRTYTGHLDDIVHVSWRSDSLMFMTTARDMTVKLYSLNSHADYNVITLGGHKDTVVSAWWTGSDHQIHSVSQDGSFRIWECETLVSDCADNLPLRYFGGGKSFFQRPSHAKVITAVYHPKTKIAVIGFSTGVFGLWELPSMSSVHTLSLGSHSITACSVNASGEWLAFGASALGQLVVWEWGSETYILKQQGHAYDLGALAYNAMGVIATGGDDAKVKVWNDAGLCYVTLHEHSAPISGLQFSKAGRVLVSSSYDGTVRAWDMTRYRNFKTYTASNPVQFGCLAVDEAGDLVCAGSVDSFEVFVWAVQTGKLLEILTGHLGPVSCLAFAGTHLVTGSWDRTLRVWNIYDRTLVGEAMQLSGEVLALSVRPDNLHVAAATLDGLISIWDVLNGTQVFVIDGRRDIKGGRKVGDRTTAKNSGTGKCFTTITFSADGEYILAGGRSKWVCIYHVQSGTLIRRFQLSHNLALDGIKDQLNSRRMTKSGVSIDEINRNLDDLESEKLGLSKTKQLRLPGVARGDLSERSTTFPEVRTSCVRFAPTGQSFAAATTEGLVIYALDEKVLFDPFDLEVEITPFSILETLNEEQDFGLALIMALKLNESTLIRQVLESIPTTMIDLLAKEFPCRYLFRLLGFIANYIPGSCHLEFALLWSLALLKYHGNFLKREGSGHLSILRLLQKTMSQFQSDLSKVCDENMWTMQFLLAARRQPDFEPLPTVETPNE